MHSLFGAIFSASYIRAYFSHFWTIKGNLIIISQPPQFNQYHRRMFQLLRHCNFLAASIETVCPQKSLFSALQVALTASWYPGNTLFSGSWYTVQYLFVLAQGTFCAGKITCEAERTAFHLIIPATVMAAYCVLFVKDQLKRCMGLAETALRKDSTYITARNVNIGEGWLKLPGSLKG